MLDTALARWLQPVDLSSDLDFVKALHNEKAGKRKLTGHLIIITADHRLGRHIVQPSP